MAHPGHGRTLMVDAGGDLNAVNALPIGIRALGVTARCSSAERAGEAGLVLRFGGVHCHPGDGLYADAVLLSREALDLP